MHSKDIKAAETLSQIHVTNPATDVSVLSPYHDDHNNNPTRTKQDLEVSPPIIIIPTDVNGNDISPVSQEFTT